MKPFCIVCGSHKQFENRMCKSCFSKRINLGNIDNISIKFCKICSKFSLKKAFQDQDTIYESLVNKIKKEISKNIKLHSKKLEISTEIKDIDLINLEIKISNGKSLEIQKEINIDLEELVCPRCNKIRGKYYEAILQLRCKDKNKLVEVEEFIFQKIDENTTDFEPKISDIKKVKGGIDYYLAKKNLAKKLIKEIKSKFIVQIKESHKIKGQDNEGREEYRTTYSVRISKYNIGDVIAIKGKTYKILGFIKNRINLYDLDKEEEIFLDIEKIFSKSTKLKKPKTYIVISKWQNTLQISNKNHTKTYEIETKNNYNIGDKIKVIKDKKKSYIV